MKRETEDYPMMFRFAASPNQEKIFVICTATSTHFGLIVPLSRTTLKLGESNSKISRRKLTDALLDIFEECAQDYVTELAKQDCALPTPVFMFDGCAISIEELDDLTFKAPLTIEGAPVDVVICSGKHLFVTTSDASLEDFTVNSFLRIDFCDLH